MRIVLLAAIAVCLSILPGAGAEVIEKEAVPGVYLTVATLKDIDLARCLPADAPEIEVTTPPKKGETLIGLVLTTVTDGDCRDTMVDARVLLYKANGNASGTDRFEYTLKRADHTTEKVTATIRILGH
jgi:hypothetical protein